VTHYYSYSQIYVSSKLLVLLYPPWPQGSEATVHKRFAMMMMMKMLDRKLSF